MRLSELPKAFYPVSVDLTGKMVLLIGGGQVCSRKLERLVTHACQLVVLSPACHDSVLSLVEAHDHVVWLKRWYAFEYLEEIQPHLVLACTNDAAANRLIVEHCQRLGIWVNSATHSDFQGDMLLPAVATFAEGALALTVSTQAAAPALSHYYRERLEAHFNDADVRTLVTFVSALREGLKRVEPEQAQRQAYLKQVLAHPELEAQVAQHAADPLQLLPWALSVLGLPETYLQAATAHDGAAPSTHSVS